MAKGDGAFLGVLGFIFTAFLVVILSPVGYRTDQETARCVEKCESMPAGCVFDTVSFPWHGPRVPTCSCKCSWPMAAKP